MRGTGHRDETGDHKYFSQTPHLLDESGLNVYEYRLYGHYKRVCSPNEVCYESVRTAAAACQISVPSVIRARRGLAAKGWIIVQLDGTGRSHTVQVTLVDRWQENMDRYAKRSPQERLSQERYPQDRNATVIEPERSPGLDKEEPIKKNHEEDPSPSERGNHKGIDPDFVDLMIETWPTLDVRREYDKFRDWKAAKGKRFKDDRAAFRNWLRKAEEFDRERKQNVRAKAGRGAIRGDADLNEWERYKAGVPL